MESLIFCAVDIDTAQESNISTQFIKENEQLFADFLHAAFNEHLELGHFVTYLKWADVTLIFKKGQWGQKDNYRPVSILLNISKLFERVLTKQLSLFFDKIFFDVPMWLSKRF